MEEQNVNYPTDWFGGKLYHSIVKNRIRYLDKDIIEVELAHNKSFVTDAKFLPLVEKYHMGLKLMSGDIFSVVYSHKKTQKSFSKLITENKITCISYRDGNHMNLKLGNLCQYGEIIVKETGDKEINHDLDHYDLLEYFAKGEICRLPRGVWILGKPAGSVFKRTGVDDIYYARINDINNRQCSKTFNIKNYSSDEEARIDAVRWQYNASYKMGVTKNLIKIINNEFIEVMLTKDKTMTTDIVFLPLIQKIPVFVYPCWRKNTGVCILRCSCE